MEYNRTAIRGLIVEAFSEDELVMFCSDYFSEVVQSLSSEMPLKKKAFVLVEYCRRQAKLGELIEKIKAENPGKYEEYQDQLEGGEGVSALLEEGREEVSEISDIVESVSSTESSRRRTPAEPPIEGGNRHPLSGDPQSVKQWFLQELSPDERIFVMTAALFSGLERQELMQVYEDVLSILRPSEAHTEGGAQNDYT